MAELKISPPPFPNRDEYPFVATVRFRKMVIDIENLDGSTREGKDPNGKTWKTEFRGSHYGEIRGSKGTDGDPLDVYIKNPPDDNSNTAYIVHQNHPRTHPKKAGQYDEDKVILGVSSAKEAKELYLKHYNRKDFFRSITEMPLEAFKRYISGENKAEKVAYGNDPERVKRATKNLVTPSATAFIRMKLRGELPMAKETVKSATISDCYKLGYKLGMQEKMSQMGGISAAPPSPKPIAGVTAPNWPKQMPQAGGQTTPIADIKAQTQQGGVQPGMLNKNLTPGT